MLGTKTKREGTGPFPPETVTQRKTRRVTFSKDFLRYSYEGPKWTPEIADFVQQSYVSVYNGRDSKSYYANAFGEHPLGFVHKIEQRHQDADSLYLQPVLRHFRPLHPSMGRMSSSESTRRRQGGEIDNRSCVIIDQKRANRIDSFWLDPGRDFVMLRAEKRDGAGKLFEQLDISYSLDRAHGWVPRAWRGLWNYSFDNGRSLTLVQSFQARVSSYEINFPFRSEDFEFSFPTGTLVEDQRYGNGYIARAQDQKRMITQQERLRNPSYRDLLNSESGMAARPRRVNWAWIIVCSLPLPVFMLSYMLLRKRRAKV